MRNSAESANADLNAAFPNEQLMDSPSEEPRRPSSFLPQFGIAEIMMATMIFCVMAAAGNYLRTAVQNGQGRAVFAIFTLASPMALVLILSAYQAIKRWVKRLDL